MRKSAIYSAWRTVRRPLIRASRDVRRRSSFAWRGLRRPLVRGGRRLWNPIERAADHVFNAACRVKKRGVRRADLTWVVMCRTGRHSRVWLWRYTLHHPIRWGNKYGWWAWKRVHKAFTWVIYRVYGEYGTRMLKAVRFFDTLIMRLHVLGAMRWHGSVLFRRLMRLPMMALPPSANHIPPLYKEVRGIHLKERGRSYEQSFKGPWGKLRYLEALQDGVQKKRFMWETYTRLSRPVLLNVPYVYVALHFQPERTTSSLGGPFADQYLLVDMIARCVPRGWKVYVKEHPSQFYPPFCGERSRHADFYTDLQRLPGVELVSLSTSSFQLIDHARAVATVTGTVGWEAIIRGTPALVFGSSWYRSCEGVWHVPTEKALREAFTWIEAGVRPDYRKVRLFMLALDRVCARAGLGYGTPDEVELGLSHDETVTRLSALLHRSWIHMQEHPLPSGQREELPPLRVGEPVDLVKI